MKNDEVDLEENEKVPAKHLLYMKSYDFQAKRHCIFWQGKEGASASLESSENIEDPVVLGLFTETPHF